MKRTFFYISYLPAKLRSWLKSRRGKSASGQRWVLYLSCQQLSLEKFLACLFDSNLQVLIISGKPPIEELAQAWTKIYWEYMDLNTGNESDYLLQLQKEITILHGEIVAVEAAIYFLSPVMIKYSEGSKDELLKSLARYGYRTKIDFDDPDYSDKLQIIHFKLAPKRLRLEQRNKELNDYLKARAKQTIDKTYFTKILRRLATFQKVIVIRPKDITVEEFVFMVNEYLEHIHSNQKEMEDAK